MRAGRPRSQGLRQPDLLFVGLGGIDKRPLLPEHDLENAENLLISNRWQVISLMSSGPLAQFYRDGRRSFALRDAAPHERE